jgi:hypothetical protein
MDQHRIQELLNEYAGYDPTIKLADVRGTARLGEFLFLLRYLNRTIPHLEWLSKESAEYADGASDATPAAKFLTLVEETANTLLDAANGPQHPSPEKTNG